MAPKIQPLPFLIALGVTMVNVSVLMKMNGSSGDVEIANPILRRLRRLAAGVTAVDYRGVDYDTETFDEPGSLTGGVLLNLADHDFPFKVVGNAEEIDGVPVFTADYRFSKFIDLRMSACACLCSRKKYTTSHTSLTTRI